MDIKFVDLKREYEIIGKKINDALFAVIDSTDFILGKEVTNFEHSFAAFIGVRSCLGVGSGLDALRLALVGAGIGNNDEVILPVNTFVATALAVSSIGARPVFVDCDRETFQIDCSQIEDRINKRTKAIIPVHLAGMSADMNTLIEIAKMKDLIVIEDAAQAHGAMYEGRKCGSMGLIGCFSFYPGKNLGCYGDGGAVTTNNEEIYKHLAMHRNYGQEKKYYHKCKGTNSRLDTIQAAILNIKLRYLEENNTKRYKAAQLYKDMLKNAGDIDFQKEEKYGNHIYHLFIITTDYRDALMKHLQSKGVQVGIHYPIPIHFQEAYKDSNSPQGAFPNAEYLAEKMLSLPMHPYLTVEEIEYTVDAIREFFG